MVPAPLRAPFGRHSTAKLPKIQFLWFDSGSSAGLKYLVSVGPYPADVHDDRSVRRTCKVIHSSWLRVTRFPPEVVSTCSRQNVCHILAGFPAKIFVCTPASFELPIWLSP